MRLHRVLWHAQFNRKWRNLTCYQKRAFPSSPGNQAGRSRIRRRLGDRPLGPGRGLLVGGEALEFTCILWFQETRTYEDAANRC